MKHKNTLQKGRVRFVIFRESADWYAAVLEFNIIESGTTPREAYLLATEAAAGYLASARKIKARPHILNQKPNKEYEAMWRAFHESNPNKKTLKDIFSAGEFSVSGLINKNLVPA